LNVFILHGFFESIIAGYKMISGLLWIDNYGGLGDLFQQFEIPGIVVRIYHGKTTLAVLSKNAQDRFIMRYIIVNKQKRFGG